MSPEQKLEFSHVETTILRVVAELTHGFTGRGDLTPLGQFVDELHSRYSRAIGTVTSTVNIYNHLILDDKVLVIGGCFADEANEGTDKDASWFYEVVRISTDLVASYVLQADVDVLTSNSNLDTVRELIAEVQGTEYSLETADYTSEDVEEASETFLTVFYVRAEAKGVQDPGSIISASCGEFEVDIIVRENEVTAATFGAAQIVGWARKQEAAK